MMDAYIFSVRTVRSSLTDPLVKGDADATNLL